MTEKRTKTKGGGKLPFFMRGKDLLEDWKIIAGLAVTAVLSAIIRFSTFSQLCFDAVLGFVMGYSFYEMLDYFTLSGETRSGISGMVILCSRPLYEALNKAITEKFADVLAKRMNKND